MGKLFAIFILKFEHWDKHYYTSIFGILQFLNKIFDLFLVSRDQFIARNLSVHFNH